MSARPPTLPRWKIDLVREALKFVEGEKGGNVSASKLAKRIPSLPVADIEIAMTFLNRASL